MDLTKYNGISKNVNAFITKTDAILKTMNESIVGMTSKTNVQLTAFETQMLGKLQSEVSGMKTSLTRLHETTQSDNQRAVDIGESKLQDALNVLSDKIQETDARTATRIGATAQELINLREEMKTKTTDQQLDMLSTLTNVQRYLLHTQTSQSEITSRIIELGQTIDGMQTIAVENEHNPIHFGDTRL